MAAILPVRYRLFHAILSVYFGRQFVAIAGWRDEQAQVQSRPYVPTVDCTYRRLYGTVSYRNVKRWPCSQIIHANFPMIGTAHFSSKSQASQRSGQKLNYAAICAFPNSRLKPTRMPCSIDLVIIEHCYIITIPNIDVSLVRPILSEL